MAQSHTFCPTDSKFCGKLNVPFKFGFSVSKILSTQSWYRSITYGPSQNTVRLSKMTPKLPVGRMKCARNVESEIEIGFCLESRSGDL